MMRKKYIQTAGILTLTREILQRYHIIPDQELGLEDFKKFLQTVNQELSFVKMQVKDVRCEDTGVEYYGLASQASTADGEVDDFAKQVGLSESELRWFRLVLDEIVSETTLEVRKIGDTRAIGLHSQINGLSLQDVVGLKDRLVGEGWLRLDDKGKLSIGIRGLLDLRGYLLRRFKVTADEESLLPECNFCMETIISGQSCTSCSYKAHHYCAAKFPLRKGPEGADVRKCPQCASEWPELLRPLVATRDPRPSGLAASETGAVGTAEAGRRRARVSAPAEEETRRTRRRS